ncbi:hypothetical protein C8R45DRAFT_929807 [Mycena sanguinolenta]|nr:hypothetical protein C8R45DRAFT_929807 [Mycena sanguinolenta]
MPRGHLRRSLDFCTRALLVLSHKFWDSPTLRPIQRSQGFIHGLGFDEDDDEDDSLSESESGSGSEDEHSHSEEEDGREGAGADGDDNDMEEREAGAAGVEDGVDMEMDGRLANSTGRKGSAQGFVWNQDLFVPPYIKARWASPPSIHLIYLPYCHVASISPPSSIPNGFVSTSVSSTNSALTDYDNYDVEVVEICVQEGEFAGIIP